MKIADLYDEDASLEELIDIFAVGFEEIVDLNASNIVSARLDTRSSLLYFFFDCK